MKKKRNQKRRKRKERRETSRRSRKVGRSRKKLQRLRRKRPRLQQRPVRKLLLRRARRKRKRWRVKNPLAQKALRARAWRREEGRASNGIGVDATTVCTAIGDDDDARIFVQYSSVAAKVASIAHVQRSNANVWTTTGSVGFATTGADVKKLTEALKLHAGGKPIQARDCLLYTSPSPRD